MRAWLLNAVEFAMLADTDAKGRTWRSHRECARRVGVDDPDTVARARAKLLELRRIEERDDLPYGTLLPHGYPAPHPTTVYKFLLESGQQHPARRWTRHAWRPELSLRVAERLVLHWLIERRPYFGSHLTLAGLTGLSAPHVDRALRELRRVGLVTTTHRRPGDQRPDGTRSRTWGATHDVGVDRLVNCTITQRGESPPCTAPSPPLGRGDLPPLAEETSPPSLIEDLDHGSRSLIPTTDSARGRGRSGSGPSSWETESETETESGDVEHADAVGVATMARAALGQRPGEELLETLERIDEAIREHGLGAVRDATRFMSGETNPFFAKGRWKVHAVFASESIVSRCVDLANEERDSRPFSPVELMRQTEEEAERTRVEEVARMAEERREQLARARAQFGDEGTDDELLAKWMADSRRRWTEMFAKGAPKF